MAENELAPPYPVPSQATPSSGGDGTVWGGEFLRVDADGWERVAHLRQFRLPGGEAAVREPRRVALSLLHQLEAERLLDGAPASRRLAFTPEERRVLRAMLGRELNAPLTSSAGRLFDGVAALLGLRQIAQFEGQAAMELEWAIGPAPTDEAYPHSIDNRASPMVVDWAPTLLALLEDLERGVQPGVMAARFHNALVEMIVAVARRSGQERVALSGGCFQNMYLLERTVVRLRQAGFQVAWQQRVPPNDGGIALGQIVAAARHAGARRQEG
jgi:hydrogenase maturation protein HypF